MLMTDHYRAFSASTSNFPGQIQSINIDTSSKSILTCLYNNEKYLKSYLSKMFPRLCFPPNPPHGAELWGAESLQSPTLTDLPARGSSNALFLQFLYIWGKKPHLLPCGSTSSTLTTSFWCQVCFCFSAVVNLHFSCPKSASVLSSYYSWYQLTWNCLQLEFSVNDRFKAFVPISHSLFKQRQIPPLRAFTNVLRFCVNIWGDFWTYCKE